MLRSILYAHLSESLSGLSTIRSYGEVARFVRDSKYFVDLEDRALVLTYVSFPTFSTSELCAQSSYLFFVSVTNQRYAICVKLILWKLTEGHRYDP